MTDLKSAIADAKKCVKEGNPVNKCMSDVTTKYHLNKDDKAKVRKAVATKKE